MNLTERERVIDHLYKFKLKKFIGKTLQTAELIPTVIMHTPAQRERKRD